MTETLSSLPQQPLAGPSQEEHESVKTGVFIRIDLANGDPPILWTFEKFMHRFYMMREMYQVRCDFWQFIETLPSVTPQGVGIVRCSWRMVAISQPCVSTSRQRGIPFPTLQSSN